MTAGMFAWGKCAPDKTAFHHLIHHSADVSAVFSALLEQPVFRRRAETALGRPLDEGELRGLIALVFLHDIGKLAPGFQAKGWTEPSGASLGVPLRGHLECGWLWTRTLDARSLAGAAGHVVRWPAIGTWLLALFAHHGRPVGEPESGPASPFDTLRHIAYDWKAEEQRMGEALLAWFPDLATARPPPASPRFVHFFCGLLTLADWIGSDRRAFPFEAAFRPDYWHTAQALAERRVREIGLSPHGLALRGGPGWALISDHVAPRPAQEAIGDVSPGERLILLEAETGAGKTEAALWRC